MLIPLLGDTSGARAYKRACERRAGRGRGLRGVMEDVGDERFEKELPRGQPFDEAHGRSAARARPRRPGIEATRGSFGGVDATASA